MAAGQAGVACRGRELKTALQCRDPLPIHYVLLPLIAVQAVFTMAAGQAGVACRGRGVGKLGCLEGGHLALFNHIRMQMHK